jgi:hypothetical protein
MDVSTSTLTAFVPKWGSPDEWNEAYEKVENYLRACRINSRLHRARLIHRVLERLAERGPSSSNEPLSTRAIRETQALVDGRVGLLLCDGPERWPYAFLTSGDLPEEFVREMRASMLVAGPNLEISSMVPRQIDYGWLPEIAGDTLEQIGRSPVLKAVMAWLLFVALLALLFYITR